MESQDIFDADVTVIGTTPSTSMKKKVEKRKKINDGTEASPKLKKKPIRTSDVGQEETDSETVVAVNSLKSVLDTTIFPDYEDFSNDDFATPELREPAPTTSAAPSRKRSKKQEPPKRYVVTNFCFEVGLSFFFLTTISP